jgi:hypothetical protein
MARSEWGNLVLTEPGTHPFAANFFIAAVGAPLWNGEHQDKRFSFISLQLYSPGRTVSGLRVLGSGVGALSDLVILGSDGKLDAELASGDPRPTPSIDFLHC